MLTLIFILVILLAAINGWTILRFRQDKLRARRGERRIAEAELLWLALIGGSAGALFARQAFRHKTRKQPFSTRLWLIILVQLFAVTAFGIFLSRTGPLPPAASAVTGSSRSVPNTTRKKSDLPAVPFAPTTRE